MKKDIFLNTCFLSWEKINQSFTSSVLGHGWTFKIYAKKQFRRFLIFAWACFFLYFALNAESLISLFDLQNSISIQLQSVFWAFFVSIVSWIVLVKWREYKNNQIIAKMLMNEYNAIKKYMIETILYSKGRMHWSADTEYLLDHNNFKHFIRHHGLMDDFADYISPGSVYYNDFYQRFRMFHDTAIYAKNNYACSSEDEIAIIDIFCNFIYRVERTNPDCSASDDKMIKKFVYQTLSRFNHVSGPRNYDINELCIKCLLI